MDNRIWERAAAAIVGEVLGVPLHQTDVPGAPPGTADFSIDFPTGACPLEVTRAVDGSGTAFWKALNRRGGVVRGVTGTWLISVGDAGANVADLWSELQKVLPLLERLGIDKIDTSTPGVGSFIPDPESPWAPLAQVNVRRARRLSEDPPGTVYVGNTGSYITAPDAINDLALSMVTKQDNSAKVGAYGHLFIWVDRTVHRFWEGMHIDDPPDVPTSLSIAPTIWVARRKTREELDTIEADRLWRLREGRWESLFGLPYT